MPIDRRKISQLFDRVADRYDRAAALPREIESRLLDKLDGLSGDAALTPVQIADIGAGTGSAAAQLLSRYPNSEVALVDLSEGMLANARRRLAGYGERASFHQAEAAELPFADRSVDLIVSNLMLPWRDSIADWLDECRRILSPGGRLLFSSSGPDTLYELRASWQQASGRSGRAPGVDMHLIGDELLRAGFADPVVDVERLTVTYPSVSQLLAELRALGVKNFNQDAPTVWPGRAAPARLRQIYHDNFRDDDRIWISLEIVYGATLAPSEGQPRRSGDGTVAEFSVEQLRGSRRS